MKLKLIDSSTPSRIFFEDEVECTKKPNSDGVIKFFLDKGDATNHLRLSDFSCTIDTNSDHIEIFSKNRALIHLSVIHHFEVYDRYPHSGNVSLLYFFLKNIFPRMTIECGFILKISESFTIKTNYLEVDYINYELRNNPARLHVEKISRYGSKDDKFISLKNKILSFLRTEERNRISKILHLSSEKSGFHLLKFVIRNLKT